MHALCKVYGLNFTTFQGIKESLETQDKKIIGSLID